MSNTITTRAIELVKRNPEKMAKFKIFKNRSNTVDESIELFAQRAFTLLNVYKGQSKYEKVTYMTSVTTADLGWLCDKLAKAFDNHELKVNPIMDLYEALLRENWEYCKNDRDTLNAVDAFNKTGLSNVEICDAIVAFIKSLNLEHTDSNNYSI